MNRRIRYQNQKKMAYPENQKKMPVIPLNTVGIYLNLDNVEDRKQGLEEWRRQMEICFAHNPNWDAKNCHRYAELSLEARKCSTVP